MAIKVTIAEGAACEVMVAACWFLLVRGLDEVDMKVAQECKAETGNCKVPTRPLAKGALPCTVHMQSDVAAGFMRSHPAAAFT
jgi:hypothetical protein